MKKRIIVRFISLVLVFLLIPFFAVNASAEEEVKTMGWTFDTNNGGFFANNSTRSWEDGNLVQTINNQNNSWLLSPSGLSIDTSVYKYMKVRVKNSTNAPAKDKFSFEATSSEKAAFTGVWTNFGTIPNDNEYHEYTVDMTTCPDWKGVINRFRLRVTEWTCTGNVYIDYIKFESPAPGEETRSVTINTPADPCDLAFGESIVFTSNVEGEVPSKVEYFADGVSIGEATTAPYALEWEPTEKKVYYITSAATFADKTIKSKAVYLNVYDPTIIEKSAYYWRFKGVTQGWGGNNSTMSATDETLIQEVAASKINSFLLSPSGLAIDASTYKYIKVRVKADYGQPGILAVQWTTSEDNAFDANWSAGPKTYEVGKTVVSNDGLFHDYVIDLTEHEGWKGTVTRLRVKVTPWSDLGNMKATIDYIRVSDTLANGIDESDLPKPSAIVTFNSSEEIKTLTVYNGAQYTDEIIKPEYDGTYKLPAGLYTYTAEPTSNLLCKVHQNFYITEEDVEAGTKTITLNHNEWSTPGFWQVKTMFLPPVEMSNKYFSDPAPSVELKTPAFEEGRGLNSYTTQEELEAYLNALDQTASNMWLTNIGKSGYNDLNIPLVVFSKGAQNNSNWTNIEEAANALHSLGKPIVWIGAQVHGNEVSSGESALQLIYELTGSWGDEVLENVSVIVLPRLNPRGAMYNRRTPNGDNDINRDRVKLELQETQLINKMYWLFEPEVAVDAHEYGSVPTMYNGKYTYGAYDLLISPATNKNVSDVVSSQVRDLYLNPVHNALSSYGIRSMDYYDGGISSSMTEMMNLPQTNANANAMYPSFSFLIETLIPGGGYNSMVHFERRVKSHLFAAQTIIEVTSEKALEIKSLLETERNALIEKASVYDENDVIVIKQNTVTEMIDFQYIDMTTNELKTTQLPFNWYYKGSVTHSVVRPTAYIIPKTDDMALAIERLRIMGVEYFELDADTVLESGMQKYVIKSSSVATKADQGVYANTLTVDILESSIVTFENGAYVIPMDQKMSNLIGVALEPEHQSSFATFRVIDVAELAVGEILPYYRYTGDVEELEHKCDFTGDWKYDENNHWHECECGLTDTKSEHTGGNATCKELAVCTVCNQAYGQLGAHSLGEWITGTSATCDKPGEKGHYYCSVCEKNYAEDKVTEITDLVIPATNDHNYTELKYDAELHWYECKCGAIDEDSKTAHSGGNATCEEKAVCSVCSQAYGELSSTHLYESIWSYDNSKHWHQALCSHDVKADEADHNLVTKHDETGHWTECSTCGYVSSKEVHNWDQGVVTKEATTDEEGVKTYTCECGETKTESIAKLVKGCGGSIVTSIIGLFTLTGVAIFLRKKRKNF